MKPLALEDKPTTFDIQGAVRGSAAIRSFFGVEKKDEEEEDGKTIKDVDLPELLVCSLSDKDPKAAMQEAKKLVSYYLATEPHIMKASHVSEELLEKVQSIMSWPATEEDYIRASAVIPDEVVRQLMAVGTTEECRAKVKEYIDAGVTCPILFPMMPDIKPVVDAFADWC